MVDVFRLKGTTVTKPVRRGTPRHRIYSRSHRYELVTASQKPRKRPQAAPVTLDDLTVKELREQAAARNIALPSKARKADIIEALTRS